jgi:hypothetical protein
MNALGTPGNVPRRFFSGPGADNTRHVRRVCRSDEDDHTGNLR